MQYGDDSVSRTHRDTASGILCWAAHVQVFKIHINIHLVRCRYKHKYIEGGEKIAYAENNLNIIIYIYNIHDSISIICLVNPWSEKI